MELLKRWFKCSKCCGQSSKIIVNAHQVIVNPQKLLSIYSLLKIYLIWFDFIYFFYFYWLKAYFCQIKIIYYHFFVRLFIIMRGRIPKMSPKCTLYKWRLQSCRTWDFFAGCPAKVLKPSSTHQAFLQNVRTYRRPSPGKKELRKRPENRQCSRFGISFLRNDREFASWLS